MPNIATALREEILRLARKELRGSAESLKKAISKYRSEIAALKRRIQDLERQQRRRLKATRIASIPEDSEADGQRRWRAAGFAKHRQRLGLSAADCGKLIGVSALTIYNWESGKARPRASQLPAIAKIRGMGTRQAMGQLESLAG